MTRDEFTSLPIQIALGLIYDMARAKLEPMKRPDVPRPPLYDAKLSRGRKGFCWMSEMMLEDLDWWHGKKLESAQSGSEYAEKDAKTAARIGQWMAWRYLYPSDRWSGKRGDDRVTGAPPSREVAIHEWQPRSDSPKEGQAPKEEKSGYGF